MNRILKLQPASLQIKILLVVFLVVFLYASLTALLLANRLKNRITDATRDSMLSSLHLSEGKVLGELARRAEITSNLATQTFILRNKDNAAIRRMIANYLAILHLPQINGLPYIQAAYLIYPKTGQFICSGQNWTVADLKQRPWWRQVLQGIEPTEPLGTSFANNNILITRSFIGDVRLTPGPATMPIYWVSNETSETVIIGMDCSADLSETPTGSTFPIDGLYGELYDPNGLLLALPTSGGHSPEKYKLFSDNSQKKPLLAKAIAEGPDTPYGSLIYTNDKGIKVLGMYLRGAMGFIYIKEKPLDQVYGPVNQEASYVIWLSLLVAIAAALLLTWFLLHDVVHPVHQLGQAMDQLGAGKLNTRISENRQDEFGELFQQFNATAEQLEQQIQVAYVERLARRQSELEFLQAQINPHFLYNTLDCIYRLVLSGDGKEGSRAILNLSKLFRLSLGRGPSIVTISEALEQLNHYLELQRLRHGDRITVEIQVAPAILKYQIPKLLLQPVVENAFVHGLEPKPGSGMLEITGMHEGDAIHFKVVDNGVGLSEEQLRTVKEALADPTVPSSHGLANAHRRLILAYGEKWGVSLSPNPGGGLIVDIRWPANPVN
ncbi:MAG: sensor histidine kinase [Bacteroidota bacterium]